MKNVLDNSPLTNEEQLEGLVDWAESLTNANLALRKLHDSIPNKDKAKTLAALNILDEATHDLGEYLALRGIFEDEDEECQPQQMTGLDSTTPSSTESL